MPCIAILVSGPTPAFRPDRWLTGEGTFDEARAEGSVACGSPFGFGTRRCIGEHFAWTEAVVLLATLARRWNSTSRYRPTLP